MESAEKSRVVAFITPEIAISQKVHTYAGGLGFLGGSMLMSAHALGAPMVCVTILPRQGYYDQFVDQNGMVVRHVNRYYRDLLKETGINFTLLIGRDEDGEHMHVAVRELSPEVFHTAPVYFLDADIAENAGLKSRSNTLQLYGGTRASGATIDRKIAQSYLLGAGSVIALERLGVGVGVYHINESHGTFAALFLLTNAMRVGMSYEDALEHTRSRVLFTTHTPVAEGNPRYPIDRVGTITGVKEDVLRRFGGDPFDMTAAGLMLAGLSNAVSKKHLSTARKLWHWVPTQHPMVSVTNGVNRDYWQYKEFRDATTPDELASAKRDHKRRGLRWLKRAYGAEWKEEVLTAVWARRFAAYKRAWLLFADRVWLEKRLRDDTLQLIIAGKPHPDDQPMIDLWNWLYSISREEPNLLVLPGYELAMSKRLKGLADAWINTPRAPLEACGTSGMSAALNGANNISTPDGWYAEADVSCYFRFGSDGTRDYDQDAFDAEELRRCLDGRVLPMYYNDKQAWYEQALRTKRDAEEHWTSDRMLREYQQLYAYFGA